MDNKYVRNPPFGLIVPIIAFLVYANSLFNGFTLDDHSVILNNPLLKGDIPTLFHSIDTTGEAQLLPFYRPLTYLTYLTEWHLHGYNPFFIRLANVLLHCINAFLVYRLTRSINNDCMYSAFLTGILFAIHPLHSEGVDFNAGGRNTMLACTFSLLAFLVHLKSIENRKITWAAAGAFLFLTGIFSKETALMVFPFILAIEFGRFQICNQETFVRKLYRLFPYFLALSLYLAMRWMTLSRLGIQTSIVPGIGTNALEGLYVTTDLSTRLLNNIYIIPRYLLTIIWPTALANRYTIPEDLNLLALPLFCAWFFILASLGWLLSKGRSSASLFGILWLLMFWLPVSGIFFVPGAPLADRFLYIPAIGLWIILSDQLFRFFPNSNASIRKCCLTVVMLVLLLLSALTIRRNFDWKNNLTLHTRFVEQYPDNIHARAGLGKIYYGKGTDRNVALAEQEFLKVVNVEPNFPMIFTYLGNIKLETGDLQNAMDYYGKAIEVYPYDKEARINRGITLERLGRPKDAVTDYIFFMTSPGSSDNLPGGREYAQERIKALSK